MSSLWITEYARFAKDAGGGFAMNVGLEPGTDQTPVAIGGVSAASAAFGASTRLVRLHSDVNCRVAFGTSPTASANSKRLVAGATEYFGVRPGDAVAVISGS